MKLTNDEKQEIINIAGENFDGDITLGAAAHVQGGVGVVKAVGSRIVEWFATDLIDAAASQVKDFIAKKTKANSPAKKKTARKPVSKSATKKDASPNK